MRIGFNFFPYAKGKHGGAEVYLTQVVSEAATRREQGEEIVVIGDGEVLDQFPDDGFEKVPIPAFAKRGRLLRIVAEQLLMPWIVSRRRLDALVSNYVIPLAAPCRNVVIIHDMIYKRFPETLEASKRLFWSVVIPLTVWRSASVVTVSNFSAGEIVHFHPAAKRKIHVTVEGVRPSLVRASGGARPEAISDRPYLVCVATFGKHKNLQALIDAFCEVGSEIGELDLVLVGAARTPDAVANRERLVRQVGKKLSADRIRFVDHVTDDELATLYGDAVALVVPSLYEGFGLPVIEAQRFGCPVICSNRASLPEVAGEGALQFDPGQAGDLEDKIKRLWSDKPLQERLRRAARANVEKYSWGRACEQLLHAVREARS